MNVDLTPRWAPGLILDIALESHDLPDLLHKYDITEQHLDHLYTLPQFKRELLNARAELTQTGSAFRAHARVLAEAHLVTMNELMNDEATPTSQKVLIWQSLVRFAALEPPKAENALIQGGINITIAPYAALPPTIDVTPSPKAVAV